MHYLALATDYDGTIAHHGAVDEPTLAALERLRQTGRTLILITGRILDELHVVCPRLDLFDRVVAENGALLYNPATGAQRLLADPPPTDFARLLRSRGVDRIVQGRVIVATWVPHQTTAAALIDELQLPLQVILNKDAVMVLPRGVDKATGLAAAVADLGLTPQQTIGIGDAENDQTFLALCGFSAAVANALPELKQHVDQVTSGHHGAGVCELIQTWLDGQLIPLRPPTPPPPSSQKDHDTPPPPQ
ncbi:MAG: hypothetical protein KatS3mg108_0321 [Isosphaeraceae bacterium]|jgi:hydroxymethylpyrimidine pyrophosphatase-like HAD family hydrolase|nr:MAG: hypothetical protein KatS3mg108_0321 [Isosphaeraceae bacterium]